ncbi:hypothetical protein, partial [uncultured Ruminococcus sp.]|uniref:hypothetical protein n=1 Tax=uncultured Ruminococcus sp. TaxID=165186 RepID=UPI002670A7CA
QADGVQSRQTLFVRYCLIDRNRKSTLPTERFRGQCAFCFALLFDTLRQICQERVLGKHGN